MQATIVKAALPPFVTKGVFRPSLALGVLLACLAPAAADQPAPQPPQTAALDDAAFAAAVGLVRVNVAAGVGNAQSNVVDLHLQHVASDALLASRTSAIRVRSGLAGSNVRDRVTVAPTALAGASGVVQVNQTAGDGNASANAFTLRVHP